MAVANPNASRVASARGRILEWSNNYSDNVDQSVTGGASERHVHLAVGGVGFVVVRDVVAQHVWAVGISAKRHERIGVGTGHWREGNRSTDRRCGQLRCDVLRRCFHHLFLFACSAVLGLVQSSRSSKPVSSLLTPN
jgi:hypothetical protein